LGDADGSFPRGGQPNPDPDSDSDANRDPTPKPNPPQYQQGAYKTPQTTSASSVTVTYPSAQAAGDLNAVIVGWNDTTAQVSSVKDTKGNSYTLAIGPTQLSGAVSQSIFYASNIVAGGY
jgi:hypothetical protein